jgi:hypothetical protein
MAKGLGRAEQKLEAFFKQHNAAHELRLAVRRMNVPAPSRLKWVVDFVQRDLDLLQAGEREALGYDLRGLVVHSLAGQVGYRIDRKAMSETALRQYQKRIAKGLDGLLSEPPQPWQIPEVQPHVAVVEIAPSGQRKFVVRLGGDEAASVIGGVANLVAEAGEHLRRCKNPDCEKVFVADAKQSRYCDAKCSQSVRDKRRSNKEEEESNG